MYGTRKLIRANRFLTVLRGVFLFALDEELVDRDPTRRLKRERESGHWRLLTPDEQDRLLEAFEDWFRPVVLAALQTGARRADLLGTGKRREGGRPLTWDDVDLDRRVITFHQTKERKTREVPIRDELLGMLKTLRRMRLRSQHPELFVDSKGRPIAPERATERLKAAAKAARIKGPKGLRFHDLRHYPERRIIPNPDLRSRSRAYLGR